jgi:hypothetical protein
MEYLDFIKIVFHTLLLGSENELSRAPPSPASMESASTASSSMQPPDVSLTKRAPTKDPPFQPNGKTKDHVMLQFPAARSDSRPTRRCRV